MDQNPPARTLDYNQAHHQKTGSYYSLIATLLILLSKVNDDAEINVAERKLQYLNRYLKDLIILWEASGTHHRNISWAQVEEEIEIIKNGKADDPDYMAVMNGRPSPNTKIEIGNIQIDLGNGHHRPRAQTQEPDDDGKDPDLEDHDLRNAEEL